MSDSTVTRVEDADGMGVSATPAFTPFGEVAAGFCGDVCAIPSGSLSAGIASAVVSGLSDAR
ncbi:hypothetical protein ACU045_02720 [Microbacterium sp. MAHUQ-60]|uniref:hypothetical protein n=1 Tax=unclassified Microbacterium TaxID=2609290 RepID=UPI00360E7437